MTCEHETEETILVRPTAVKTVVVDKETGEAFLRVISEDGRFGLVPVGSAPGSLLEELGMTDRPSGQE